MTIFTRINKSFTCNLVGVPNGIISDTGEFWILAPGIKCNKRPTGMTLSRYSRPSDIGNTWLDYDTLMKIYPKHIYTLNSIYKNIGHGMTRLMLHISLTCCPCFNNIYRLSFTITIS